MLKKKPEISRNNSIFPAIDIMVSENSLHEMFILITDFSVSDFYTTIK